MTIKELKELLHRICEEGYEDWTLFMCDDDDDDYSVNNIYVDDDGDVCLESTDVEGEDDNVYTANGILEEIENYHDDTYVYFIEEYEDESWYAYDIESNWFIGTDYEGDDILNVDVVPCDGDDDGDGDDGYDNDGDGADDDYDGDDDDENTPMEDISKWDVWATADDIEQAMKDWEDMIDKEGHI